MEVPCRLVKANRKLWNYLKVYLQYDMAVYQMEEFAAKDIPGDYKAGN
jgi:hypothetical protein